MKKIVLSLFLSVFSISSAFSFTVEDFADSFHLTNMPNCGPSCVHLSAHGQQIGSMRSAPNKQGTIYFFDAKGQHQISLKSEKIYYLAAALRLSILDHKNQRLGRVMINRNYKSGQLMRFEIYGNDNKNPLMTGVSNLFSTKHTIYLGNTYHVLAEITRPLFTYSRDSDIKIIDKPTVLTQIDPNVFAAVVAFYCSEYYLTIADKDEIDIPVGLSPSSTLDNLEAKLKQVFAERGFTRDELKSLPQSQLQAAADLINERYHQVYDDSNLSDEEKMVQFINFGCDLIRSNSLEPTQEKAIFQFLAYRVIEMRLDAMFTGKAS